MSPVQKNRCNELCSVCCAQGPDECFQNVYPDRKIRLLDDRKAIQVDLHYDRKVKQLYDRKPGVENRKS